MTKFVALLRAVNVGGTGKLPMKDLVKLCTDTGFEDVQTYIASGNVAFSTDLSKDQAKSALENQLEAYAGRAVTIFIRTSAELERILKANPFPEKPGNQTMVIFLDDKPSKDTLALATGLKNEEIQLGEQELYVHYGDGMGRSKLKIPTAKSGTARNMNTVAKLVKMAQND